MKGLTLGPLLEIEGHLPRGPSKIMSFASKNIVLAHDQNGKLELIYPRQTRKTSLAECADLEDAYTALHEGAPPKACLVDQPRLPKGRLRVVLIQDAITYKKRTAEREPIPPYRHPYELLEHEKPTVLVDERGEYFVGNQRWITVTSRGIEDRGARANKHRSLATLVDAWWAR